MVSEHRWCLRIKYHRLYVLDKKKLKHKEKEYNIILLAAVGAHLFSKDVAVGESCRLLSTTRHCKDE